ncbi:hypothetical protein DWB85_16360 [Seongchinamella sediminis]|uniref:OmpR/PhoB-type domain-containing protein n=1 Tax=Seongchinamella sediminis TaxID=2283635 RepID=A0A3L7DXY8_9GAMM|nr:winged helix-turn-helix domain-containing protein [Seongchinamella sediminis]RLQ20702.1 hypothetical protein DWB85_16360 [Seongchinamella sediminis]
MTHPPEVQYRFGDLLFCPASGRLFRGSREVRLAPLSRKLLSALVRHTPEALSAEDLQREVWDGRYVTQATIKQRVKLLRRAIDDDGQAPRYIALDRGFGYHLIPPVTVEKPLAGTEHPSTPRDRKRPTTQWTTFGLTAVVCLFVLFMTGAVKIGLRESPGAPPVSPARANAVALVEQGDLFYQRLTEGDIERAHEFYLEAVAADPDYPEAWLALAGCLHTAALLHERAGP